MSASESRLKITEIFHSIQGESTLTGLRTAFVRVTGCPLRCTYCDTTYSYTGGTWMTLSEILGRVEEYGALHVCITGGEPLAHPNTLPLVRALNDRGKRVSIETDGEEDVSAFAGLVKIIMDIKTPGSGERADGCFKNLKHLLPTDEIKFVLCDRSDYDWAREICRTYDLCSRFTVLLSASWEQLDAKALAEWMIADKLDARLQTQLHKHIWGAATKGV